MKRYVEKHHRAFGLIGGLIAFVVALIYMKLIPNEASGATGIQESILLYGHSLCWVFLGWASCLWGIKKSNRLSKPLTYMALATYVTFIGTLVIAKFA